MFYKKSEWLGQERGLITSCSSSGGGWLEAVHFILEGTCVTCKGKKAMKFSSVPWQTGIFRLELLCMDHTMHLVTFIFLLIPLKRPELESWKILDVLVSFAHSFLVHPETRFVPTVRALSPYCMCSLYSLIVPWFLNLVRNHEYNSRLSFFGLEPMPLRREVVVTLPQMATSFKLQVEFMKLKRLVSFCSPILPCCRKLE